MTFAPHQMDFYKVSHVDQYPKGTTNVYSNMTARSGTHSNVPDSKGITFIGLQLFIKDYLIREWNETFFYVPKNKAIAKFKRRTAGISTDVSHMEALHDLGYLPVHIKALPEGSFIPYKVPMLTITNTLPEFFWVTNMLESVMSAELWQMINTATVTVEYLKTFHKWAEYTGADKSIIPIQVHDFSFRGMAGRHAAAHSGFAAIACGVNGTDCVPALDIAEDFYGADTTGIGSIPATEHSVMCAGGEHGELDTFIRLLNTYPTGPLAVVSDTWDLWNVVDTILPQLKDHILARDGTLVIRPDSGNPVDILCGDSRSSNLLIRKGLIECLWDIFGGTINDKGFKVLNSKIGAIYGDSITLKRQTEILYELADKGFASSNVVLGVGSFTYQYNTRDTHGIAMKATSVIINGKREAIFKSPATDTGVKKSAKGLLMVSRVGTTYEVQEDVTPKQEAHGCLKTVFLDGDLHNEVTFEQVRANVAKSIFEE